MRPLTIRLSSKRAIDNGIIAAFLNCSRAKIYFFLFFILFASKRAFYWPAAQRDAPQTLASPPISPSDSLFLKRRIRILENSSLLARKKRLFCRVLGRRYSSRSLRRAKTLFSRPSRPSRRASAVPRRVAFDFKTIYFVADEAFLAPRSVPYGFPRDAFRKLNAFYVSSQY